jgi:polyhydroxybutyrate depolymerase
LSVFRIVADREGFIVVYPGGLPAPDGGPGWNDCRNDNQLTSSADDLAFLNALIERVRGEYGLPASKVFMSGGSNGAQMTLAYLIAGPANVAAAATSNGNLPLNPKAGACSTPTPRRTPILMAHGSADPAMPYAGGCVANAGGGCARGRVISAEATRDFWLSANGLSTVKPLTSVIEIDPNDGGAATRFAYTGVGSVEWWRMEGGGHPVSSRLVPIAENALNGKQNRDVEFAEIAWTFFKAQLAAAQLPSAAAINAARDYSASVGGQTLLVLHNGQVLDESYANGGAVDRTQLLASATKGFTGIIGAIGAAEGLYELDEPVSQRALPEWRQDAAKSQITYRHLLTMTSGLEELNDLSGWLNYLPARAINKPGEVFLYSGDPNIFGLALERRLGSESVTNYFNRKLFQPLGMTSIRWGTNFADGHPQLSGGAYATARDWAKFGEFVRRTIEGSWSGPSLVSRPYFEQVLQGTGPHPAYGFYWWFKEPVPSNVAAVIDANNKDQFTRQIKPIIDEPLVPDDFIMLAGAYGQRLYVIPSLGLTVVRNGPTNENRFQDREFLMRLLARS